MLFLSTSSRKLNLLFWSKVSVYIINALWSSQNPSIIFVVSRLIWLSKNFFTALLILFLRASFRIFFALSLMYRSVSQSQSEMSIFLLAYYPCFEYIWRNYIVVFVWLLAALLLPCVIVTNAIVFGLVLLVFAMNKDDVVIFCGVIFIYFRHHFITLAT